MAKNTKIKLFNIEISDFEDFGILAYLRHYETLEDTIWDYSGFLLRRNIWQTGYFRKWLNACYLDLHRKQTQCVCVCVFHLSVCDICQCVRPDETVTVETNLSLIYQCYQWQGWVYCCPDQTHTHTHTVWICVSRNTRQSVRDTHFLCGMEVSSERAICVWYTNANQSPDSHVINQDKDSDCNFILITK